MKYFFEGVGKILREVFIFGCKNDFSIYKSKWFVFVYGSEKVIKVIIKV